MNSSPQAVAGGDGSALRRQALGGRAQRPFAHHAADGGAAGRLAPPHARPAARGSGPAVRHQRHLVHLDRTGPRSVGVALGLVAHRRRVAAGARRTRLSVRAGRLRRSAAAARAPAARQGRCAPAWTRSARPPMCWTAPGTCWPGTSPCASCSTTGPCAIPNPSAALHLPGPGRARAGGGLGAARARVVAEFRADAGAHLDEPAVLALADALNRQSPVFAHWWTRHAVVEREGACANSSTRAAASWRSSRSPFDWPRIRT